MTSSRSDTRDVAQSEKTHVNDPEPVQLLFVSSMDLCGDSGGNIATKEIVSSFGRNPDVDLSLICPRPDNPDLPSEVSDNLNNVWFLPEKSEGSLSWHIKSQLSMATNLWRAYRHTDPDIVVARVGPSTVMTPLSALVTRTPYVILIRGIVGRNLSFGWAADQVVRANAVLADAAYVAFQEIADRYSLESLTRTTVFPNAVNPRLFQPVPKENARATVDLPISNDDFVVGFVGSLKQRHRVDTLLEAVDNLPPEISCHVLIIGNGPLRPELESIVHELNLGGQVTFAGYVPHTELAPYISSCDVTYGVVDPTKPSNPIKCYEYLACGRPVVTSATSELEFVEVEDCGVALNDIDPRTIRDALYRLYQLDSEERAKMGQEGRRFVLEHHTWDRLTDMICERFWTDSDAR